MTTGSDDGSSGDIAVRARTRRLHLQGLLALVAVLCACWYLRTSDVLASHAIPLGDAQIDGIMALTTLIAILLAIKLVMTDDPIIIVGADSVQIKDGFGKRTIPYQAIALIRTVPILGVGIKLKKPGDLLAYIQASPKNRDRIARISSLCMSRFKCEFVIAARRFTFLDKGRSINRATLVCLLRNKSSLAQDQVRLMPESEYVVEVKDDEIVNQRPDGAIERVAFADLQAVIIETNDTGPFGADVWWLLAGNSPESVCLFPGGATGEEEVLEALQRLSGFDNERFIEAMSSVQNARFICWQAPTDDT